MEEKSPLLQGESSQTNGNSSGSSSDDKTTYTQNTSLNIGQFGIPLYGTISAPIAKPVPLEERITYSWNEINVFVSKHLPQKKVFGFCREKYSGNDQEQHVLKNVSGVAYPGELLGVLGSSGAGKTTFLNALAFRSSKKVLVTGTRCLNGVPANYKTFARVSAYVQQDDLFIGSLTVKEHLIFQAMVRMDRHLTYKQRLKRVNSVLSELGLTKCENTCIGIPGRIQGISGGERKRLSFATEIITNPSLLFCDEATSGLDSYMALTTIEVLKNMARSGKTVICTVHQPSSEIYAMFDKLLLVAEGRTAFLGTPEEADLFFRELEAACPKNYNPADYFIQLLAIVPGREESCRQAVDMICDKYERSELGVRYELDSSVKAKGGYTESDVWLHDNRRSPYKVSWCSQFRAVTWRSWLSIIKEPLLVKVRLIQTIMVAVVIGAIFYGQEINQDGVMNINGALFIFLTNMTFQNVMAVINVFCSELPVFLREHRNGMYRTDVYFLGKTVAEAPLFFVVPILFTAICYFMIGLNPELPRFFIACGILILVTHVAISFGYLISCASTGTSMALSVGPPLIIPLLLFGGFFLNVVSIPSYLNWLSYFSWFKYGNEALMINQWRGVDTINCTELNSVCPRNGQVVLEIYSFNEENFQMDIVCLCALILGFRFVAYCALLIKTYIYEQ